MPEHIEGSRPLCYYLSFILVYFMLVGLLMTPVFLRGYGVELVPVAMFFAGIVILPMTICSLVSMVRPLFQFHYHGEHTPVMDEIHEEVTEVYPNIE